MTKLQLRDLVTGEIKTLDPVMDAEEITRLKTERIDSLPRYEQIGERPTPAAVYFRNIETGKVNALDSVRDAEKIAELKRERTADGVFPRHEQTSAADADPALFASAEEVARRAEWAKPHGLPLSDVTADGLGQSDAARRKLSDGPRALKPGTSGTRSRRRNTTSKED